MNQEEVYRHSRMKKIFISAACALTVAGVIGYLVFSRNELHHHWEQSIEQIQKDSSDTAEELHHEVSSEAERSEHLSRERQEQTVSQ